MSIGPLSWLSSPSSTIICHGVGRQNVDRAPELALFTVVNHHLPWASVSATSSRAVFLRYWDPADGQKATRTSS